MKKTIKINSFILLALIISLFAGCKNALDIPSPGITQTDVPTNQDDAVALVTGCYSTFMDYDHTEIGTNGQLIDNWTEGWFCQWLVADECGDDMYKGGDSHGDFQTEEDLGYFRTGYNQVIDWKWRKMWIGVQRCNFAINTIPTIPTTAIDSALAHRLIAESKFLRAYFYLELIRNFGDVPMLTVTIDASQINQPRVAAKTVYENLVEKDLTSAAAILPQKDAYAASDADRATRGAALSLLAKVYLYEKKWSNAFTTAQTVINEGKYKLDPDYRNVFNCTNINGVESVFEIPYSSNSTVPMGFVNGAMTSRDDGGWGWAQPSTDLDREFEPNDPRRNLTIIHNGDLNIEGYVGTPYAITAANNNQTPYTNCYKYYIPPAKRVGGWYPQQNYNLQLIRYADVLLMYAEAALQSGNATQADWAVEQVRSRARTTNTPGVIIPTGTLPAKTGVTMTDLMHERRVELAIEGHRFYDLKRWGIAQSVLNALPAKIATYPEGNYIGDKGALYQSPRNDFFEIPPTDVARAGWQQNPGY